MVKQMDREAVRIEHDSHHHFADSEYEQPAHIGILYL